MIDGCNKSQCRPWSDARRRHELLAGPVLTETQDLTGVEIKRAYVDKGYVGRANAVVIATGHNFRLSLRWLRESLCKFTLLSSQPSHQNQR